MPGIREPLFDEAHPGSVWIAQQLADEPPVGDG
jgi:hypothetical protein